MTAKRTVYTKRIREAILRSELVLQHRFDIERVLRLASAGWTSFTDPIIHKLDPRLRISDFDKFKKHYPRRTEDLDVIPGRS